MHMLKPIIAVIALVVSTLAFATPASAGQYVEDSRIRAHAVKAKRVCMENGDTRYHFVLVNRTEHTQTFEIMVEHASYLPRSISYRIGQWHQTAAVYETSRNAIRMRVGELDTVAIRVVHKADVLVDRTLKGRCP